MTKNEFMAGMGLLSGAGLKGAIPRFIENGGLAPAGRIWHKLLAEVPAPVFMAVIEQVLLEETFFPTVSALYERARKLILPPELSGEEVWGLVLAEMSRVGGSYGTPEFPGNHALLEAVRAIGWRDICFTAEPDITRAQLREAYNRIRARHKLEDAREALLNNAALETDTKERLAGQRPIALLTPHQNREGTDDFAG